MILDELVKAGAFNEAEKVATQFGYDLTQLKTYQDYSITKNEPFAGQKEGGQ